MLGRAAVGIMEGSALNGFPTLGMLQVVRGEYALWGSCGPL